MAVIHTETAADDHRVRVGAQRREKTRLRLLRSALAVFAQKGTDDAVIDDFIAEAGVARGTFYNHFRTTGELLFALATAMSDEALAVIDPLVLTIDDPMARFAVGARLYMRTALRYPLWGRFITSVGTRIAARGQLIDLNLTRDLEYAKRSGRVDIDIRVARDIVLGSIFYGIETMLTEATHGHHPERMMRLVLIGFGVAPDEADAIANVPLPQAELISGPIFSGLESVPHRRAAPKRAAARRPLSGPPSRS